MTPLEKELLASVTRLSAQFEILLEASRNDAISLAKMSEDCLIEQLAKYETRFVRLEEFVNALNGRQQHCIEEFVQQLDNLNKTLSSGGALNE